MSSSGKTQLPPFAPWPKLLSAWSEWERTVRAQWRGIVASAGLSEQQWLLLWFAGEANAPGRAQTELADDINLSPAQVCLMLEDLRQRDLLIATRCPPDRRRQFWQPSPGGKRLLADCDARLRDWQSEQMPVESAAQIEPICRLLARITPNSSAKSAGERKDAA